MPELQTTDSLVQIARRALRPDPRLTVCDWADRHRQLSTVVSAEPGPYRTARVPYMREPIDHLSPASPVQSVVIMKGAQLGVTEAAINWVGYIIDQIPGPILVVLPTEATAKRWSKQRVAQLLRDTTVLHGKVRDKKSRDSSNTILEKEFNGGILIMTGANSSVGLRSMPARFRVYDEIDGFPADVDQEGDPVELAERRSATFQRGKSIKISSPTLKGLSRIEHEYISGSQAEYHVPCPHCNQLQTIRWKNIQWDRDENNEVMLDTIALACEGCGSMIEERYKTEMLAGGEWVHRFLERTVKSYFISSLYSPVGWYSWADAVVLWEKAQRKPELLKVFINTVLGETWEDRGEAPEWRRVYDRREGYARNIVPCDASLITVGVDVQKNRLEAEIVAWNRRRESWSLSYRVFMGDPDQSKVWRNLEEILIEVFPTEQGGSLLVHAMAVDSGYATQHVYNWVRTQPAQKVFSIKGTDSGMASVGTPKVIDIRFRDGMKVYRGARVWPLNSGMLKGELYGCLRSDPPTDESDEPFPVGYCHFPEYGEEYFKQLTAERLVTKVNAKGFVKLEWRKHYDRNEALDCRVYARAAGLIVGMDRWSDKLWNELESRASQKVQPPPGLGGDVPSKKKSARRPVAKPSHMR